MLLNAGQGMLHSVEQVPAIVARMQAVVGAVEGLVRRVDAVVARAGVVVENVDAMRADADATVLAVQQIERQASMLVDRCEPLLGAVIEIALGGTDVVRDHSSGHVGGATTTVGCYPATKRETVLTRVLSRRGSQPGDSVLTAELAAATSSTWSLRPRTRASAR